MERQHDLDFEQVNVLDILNLDFLRTKPRANLEIIFSDKTDCTKIEGKLGAISKFVSSNNCIISVEEIKREIINNLWLGGQVQAQGYTLYRGIKIYRQSGIIEVPVYSKEYLIRCINLNDRLVYLNDPSIKF